MKKLVKIQTADLEMEGMLNLPQKAQGLVLFAHGSGSGRFSPRNNYVAEILNRDGLATLLIDLLSPQEDEIYENRFNIELLSDRLAIAINWLKSDADTKNLSIGLFGASTGAAAALMVAAKMNHSIAAMVSRGGRPDLAMPWLSQVDAPALFIVGGNDYEVLLLNKEAYNQLTCEKSFEIIPHATHLFEEPGCLEQVAELASKWFTKHLYPNH